MFGRNTGNPPLDSKKIEIITAVYNQFHSNLRSGADYEYKVSFAAIGVFLAFAVLLLRHQLFSFSCLESVAISGFLIFVCGIIYIFLRNNEKEMLSICRRIVGFETAMGAYSTGQYLNNRTLLPKKYAKWGTKESVNNFNSWPYILLIWICAGIACAALWYNFYKQTQADNHSIPNQPISSFKLPDHFDLTLHQPDIASSALRPEHDRQLEERVKKLEDAAGKSIASGGGTSPPPPMSPPASPAPQFSVSFVYGKIDLDAGALGTISQVVASAVTAKVIFCIGYPDTAASETAKDRATNMMLSYRRAATVAAELVRQGVPVEKIVVKDDGSPAPGRKVGIALQ